METDQKPDLCKPRWRILRILLLALGVMLTAYLVAEVMFAWWFVKVIWHAILTILGLGKLGPVYF